MQQSKTVAGAVLAVVATGGLVALTNAFPADAAPLPAGCTAAGTTVTCAYSYTGSEQTFVAPAGITNYQVVAIGAAGGAYSQGVGRPGGLGALVSGAVTLTPGHSYYVEVGGSGGTLTGGWNGGGTGGTIGAGLNTGGGGGATDLRAASGGADPSANSASLASRLVAAGAGGGSGSDGAGGSGGLNGNAGGGSFSQDGKGGTQTAGGAAGSFSGRTSTATAGTSGHGGNGGALNGSSALGAGGGAGYFGGGGAVSGDAGGGGSSLVPAGGSVTTTTSPASLTITYADPTLATPLADPLVGVAAVAGIGTAALVLLSRRRRSTDAQA